jgi:hypothetical protein
MKNDTVKEPTAAPPPPPARRGQAPPRTATHPPPSRPPPPHSDATRNRLCDGTTGAANRRPRRRGLQEPAGAAEGRKIESLLRPALALRLPRWRRSRPRRPTEKLLI